MAGRDKGAEKDPVAVANGLKGSAARMAAVSPERRREIARMGALARNAKRAAEQPAVADKAKSDDLARRFITVTGKNNGPMPDLLQTVMRECGWMVNEQGHGMLSRMPDADAAWRRFLIVLPELMRLRRVGGKLSPEEQLAIDAYRGPVTKVRAHGPRPRKIPQLKPRKQRVSRIPPEKVQQAVELCVQGGFSVPEAAAEVGIPKRYVAAAMLARREAGGDMGLSGYGRTRARATASSRAQKSRRGQ